MLAIVIPYYKLTFFEQTLQSLASQTDQRFKVYIGDDASPESPIELLEEYQRKFDFVYHRFEENLGGISLTQQWERCIALSNKEKWIMILGDDDVLGENVVEAFYHDIEGITRVSNIIRFASMKIDGDGMSISKIYSHPRSEKSIDFIFRDSRSSLSEYVFNKKQILNIGFKDFPLAWFSDVLAVLEFSDFKEVITINEAVVYIRITDLSISGNQNNLKLKAKATFYFYNYLLTKKSGQFVKNQKIELLLKISKCYIYNKKELNYFFKISKIYLINFLFTDYFGFIKSIFFNVFRRK
ncbi:glycosyltransferase involved in cell wall biosynthesis [Flavobacterium limicola]|uniref:Glycosyltransferase involved in cell wall biosynthesis n=1 Tax=Flavobacterium limicola TaxID=180441 RepID=A0A495RQ10_9FLAO|nr:glycosyltransferase family 2 protein [Flavobacterium limicola]RKS89653.1 glycosyltransferase involved in cell wall biosynthesis [Flavobacterium limicola]